MADYIYGEAFCLMWYRCEQCGEWEQLWNSRDGVTPFIIRCENCKVGAMKHELWNRDERRVDFVPPPGMRIFVDLTKEKYKKFFQRQKRQGHFPKSMTFEATWKDLMRSSGGEAHPDIEVAK